MARAAIQTECFDCTPGQPVSSGISAAYRFWTARVPARNHLEITVGFYSLLVPARGSCFNRSAMPKIRSRPDFTRCLCAVAVIVLLAEAGRAAEPPTEPR